MNLKNVMTFIKGMPADILFPPVCPICDEPVLIGQRGKTCDGCRGRIRTVSEPVCFKCGRPIGSEEAEYCDLCSEYEYHFRKNRAVFVYRDEAKRLILDLKYKGRQDLAAFFTDSLILKYNKEIKNIRADAIIPIPIHKTRLKQRGYNQSFLLADELSIRTGIPVVSNLLLRTKETKAQKQLGSMGRLLNLCDAFEINRDVLRKIKTRTNLERIILVDDIYTTGSTIESCSIVLGRCGINEIYSFTMCITGYIDEN